jgi:hypothetical protein
MEVPVQKETDGGTQPRKYNTTVERTHETLTVLALRLQIVNRTQLKRDARLRSWAWASFRRLAAQLFPLR